MEGLCSHFLGWYGGVVGHDANGHVEFEKVLAVAAVSVVEISYAVM